MIRRTLAIVILVLCTLVSVRDARATTNAELVEMIVQMFEQIATVVSHNGSSCDALGDSLEQYYNANAEFMRQARAAYEQIPPDEKKTLKDRYKTRYQAAIAKIQPGVVKCLSHPKVSTVVREVRSLMSVM